LKILIKSDILKGDDHRRVANSLATEAEELRKIISAIIKKASDNESNI